MFGNYKKNFMIGGAIGLGVNGRSHGPKLIEYDVNGNELTLMQLFNSPSSLNNFWAKNEDEIDQKVKDVFPKQFWTKYTATGETTGYGVEEGFGALAIKTSHGKFWGVYNREKLLASSERAGPWEKFSPIIHAGNLVSLLSDDGSLVSCQNDAFSLVNGAVKLTAYRSKVSELEQFYVYKTAACGSEYDTPANGSECIAFKNKATGSWLSADSSYSKQMQKVFDISMFTAYSRAMNTEVTCY
jgi:hypothetical protein